MITNIYKLKNTYTYTYTCHPIHLTNFPVMESEVLQMDHETVGC